MADRFLDLGPAERYEALAVAAERLGRPAHLLEKDVYVVRVLETLFASHIGPHLAFKGGTSLSKAYGAIRRFSEDVDVTYDIRRIVGHLMGKALDPRPPSKSQAKKWTKAVRERLPQWIDSHILPLLTHGLEADGLPVNVRREGDVAFVEYEPLVTGTGYVRPAVLLEFGARSMGEPVEQRKIGRDAAPAIPEVSFPSATPRVTRAERTFWEKATAIHVYCLKGDFRGGERYARHWSDLVALDDCGIAECALADRPLARDVATHKGHFFAENDAHGQAICYDEAVSGRLRLVPEGAPLRALRDDYRHMVGDGLLTEAPFDFDDLMDRCKGLEGRANGQGRT
jgi:hypothetical protein